MAAKNKREDTPPMLPASSVRERGWTDSLIQAFLGEPDKLVANPRYKKAAPMRLYLVSRVEQVESTRDFQAAREASKARKIASAKAVQTKLVKVLAYVESVKVRIPILDLKVIRKRACDNYNRHPKQERTGDSFATDQSDIAFLDRITVNYVRHRMTSYEAHLAEMYGRTGIGEAYTMLRNKVLAAIAEAYPELAPECERQQLTATTGDADPCPEDN